MFKLKFDAEKCKQLELLVERLKKEIEDRENYIS
jgi:hypothetical protein